LGPLPHGVVSLFLLLIMPKVFPDVSSLPEQLAVDDLVEPTSRDTTPRRLLKIL
jgi:hypothetical protein